MWTEDVGLARPARLVFVTRSPPFPATNGAAIRTHRLLTGLAEVFEVTLVTLEHEHASIHPATTAAEAERLLPGVRVVAAPGLAAGKRLGQVRSLATSRSWECGRYARRALRNLLVSEVRQLRPALVHFDDVGVGLAGPLADVYCVLAPHNIEHRILRQVACASGGARRLFGTIDSRKVEREERSLWPRMSLCLAVSDIDARTMRQGGARRVEICPNGTDPVPRLPPQPRSPHDPLRILFVGTGQYHPNVRGLRWFIEQVLPMLRRHVPAVLDIVGDPPPLRAEAPGVTYLGRVAELKPHYERAHAAIVPLFEGSGTRLKAIEAAAWGRPIVSTPLGSEGLALTAGEHFLAAETAQQFVAALTSVARWYETPDARLERLLDGARAVAEQLFWPRITARLASLYEELARNGHASSSRSRETPSAVAAEAQSLR